MSDDLLARVRNYRAAYCTPGDNPANPRQRAPFSPRPEPLRALLDDIERHLEAQ